MKLGINGENMVYLDLSHIDADYLDKKLGGILEIYEKFVGDDPRKVPMKIFPAPHYTMGGIWSNANHMTNISGLFSAGECDYQYHGANRLGANSLLSAIYSGSVVGPSAIKYANDQKGGNLTVNELQAANQKQLDRYEQLLRMAGSENPFQLHQELGDVMLKNVTIIRLNEKLKQTDEKIQELLTRWDNIGLDDKSRWCNQTLIFTRQLRDMMELARVITLGALQRNESRGAHYKPEFPERDDENWLKTTKALFTPAGPQFSYEAVDVSLIKPRARRYDVAKEGK
jgi:succinate dehydrogenase / fumarate reductase flavoprotein subunit